MLKTNNGLSRVVSAKIKQTIGLYNPYTTSGTLIVKNITTSCHSDWFLEDVVSDSSIHYIYQNILSPVRLIYYSSPSFVERFHVLTMYNKNRALSKLSVFEILYNMWLSI